MGYLLIIGIMLDPKKFNRNPQLRVKEGFKKGINVGYVGLEKHKTESGLPKQLWLNNEIWISELDTQCCFLALDKFLNYTAKDSPKV